MKPFNILLFLLLFIFIKAFTQTENDKAFSQKIEEQKNAFRDIGLTNLDKIEGIYLVKEIQDWRLGDVTLSQKNEFDFYFSIKRISSGPKGANAFYISFYDDSKGEFWGNRFFIIKDSTKYLLKRFQTGGDSSENEVILFNNGFSAKYEMFAQNGQGLGYYFNSIQKLFPNSLENNIFKSGTGFFISKNGYIITNFHVIQHASNIYISNNIYNRIKAEVISIDEINDIALLKANIMLKSIPLNLFPDKKEIGESVFTLGYPFIETMGKEIKLTNGIINSNSGFEDDSRYYQFSAEIEPGNSGSPLFDSEGNIVGLVSARHNQATNAGYALKSNLIIDFLKKYNPTLLKTNINSLKNLNLSTKYKVLKNYVLLLEIE